MTADRERKNCQNCATTLPCKKSNAKYICRNWQLQDNREQLFNVLNDLFEDRPDQCDTPYGKIMEVIENYEKLVKAQAVKDIITKIEEYTRPILIKKDEVQFMDRDIKVRKQMKEEILKLIQEEVLNVRKK